MGMQNQDCSLTFERHAVRQLTDSATKNCEKLGIVKEAAKHKVYLNFNLRYLGNHLVIYPYLPAGRLESPKGDFKPIRQLAEGLEGSKESC